MPMHKSDRHNGCCCCCCWEDCASLQLSLAAMKHGAAGPLACIKVGKDPSAKTTAFVKNIVHHLNAPSGLREYNIARHHWHLCLLQDLHPVASKKPWTVSLISKDPKKYNIYEQCDRFNSSLFFQSPNVPLDIIRGYVSSSTSEQSGRKLRRQAFFSSVNPCNTDSKCPVSTQAPATTESSESTKVPSTTKSSKVAVTQLAEMIKEPTDNDHFHNQHSKLVLCNPSPVTVTPSRYRGSPRCAPGEVDSYITNSMHLSPAHLPKRPCMGLNNKRVKTHLKTESCNNFYFLVTLLYE
jgi:hypothetical protein